MYLLVQGDEDKFPEAKQKNPLGGRGPQLGSPIQQNRTHVGVTTSTSYGRSSYSTDITYPVHFLDIVLIH